jgi:hypothetical protein
MKIKLTGEIIKNVRLSRYSKEDLELVESINDFEFFGQGNDYIEHYIYDSFDNLINSKLGYTNYKLPKDYSINQDGSYSIIEIDPVKDVQVNGYETGEYKTFYHFFRNLIGNPGKNLSIKDISGDRTEISCIPVNIDNAELETSVNKILKVIENSEYIPSYLLNFGDNNQILCINIALDKTNPEEYKVLFKLLNPLPQEYNLKRKFWFVEELTNSIFFNINLSKLISLPEAPKLQGPNFNIDISGDNNKSNSESYTYNSIISSSIDSSINELSSKLTNKSYDININYEITSSNSFDEFVRFSSAKKRVDKFWNKVEFIETKNDYINLYEPLINVSSSLSSSVSIARNDITSKINTFDGFENYLYFTSGSNTYPKITDNKPYLQESVTSSIALDWYSNLSELAILHDNINKDNLINLIPNFISEDEINEPYVDFVHMTGHYFDNLWIYIKSITDLYKNDNNVNKGISKDFIHIMLKSLGLELSNNYEEENLYNYVIGSNTGSIDLTNLDPIELDAIPKSDLKAELGKRLYNNLPYLLKNKGTLPGLKALINIFGIPTSILRIDEYGGSDNSSDTFEYSFNKYYNSLQFDESANIRTKWGHLLDTSETAKSLELRFKPSTQVVTQSLFTLEYDSNEEAYVDLFYTGSDGGYLEFSISGSGGITSTTMSGAFYNGEWWNLLINKGDDFEIFSKTSKEDSIFYNLSSSIETTTSQSWDDVRNYIYIGGNARPFSGSLNNFRLWTESLNENKFDKHVLNPGSYEGNSITSSYYTLGAYFPLGLDTKTYNHYNITNVYSNHPNQTISSFTSGSTEYSDITFINFSDEDNYDGNNEIFYINSPDSGTYKRVSDKIRIISKNVVTGSYDSTGKMLLPDMSLEEDLNDKYTVDKNLINISFSPSNEINNDIINHFGHFDMGEYLGDPANSNSSSYSELTDLKNEYFMKYSSSYDYEVYNKYVGYFDNSLFKLVENFVPSRSNLSTGITIQSNILERPKYKNISFENSTTESLHQMNISSFTNGNVNIIGQNDHYWELLGGNRKSFINGEIEGTAIDVYQYFENANFNPYLLSDPTILNEASKSYDDIAFKKSEYNVLKNNVDSYRSNPKYKVIENNGTSSSSLSSFNDYYNNLTSFNNSRYKGSKSTSFKYNIYTSSSYVPTSSIKNLKSDDPNISGSYYLINEDDSYSKNPSIDIYDNRLGLFTQITENKFFIDKNDVSLKYLVDRKGEMIELNKRNENWNEVQSLFKLGENTIVSLFDDQKFTDHKKTNGSKTIFSSGYSYSSIFYIHKDDEKITIQNSAGFIEQNFQGGSISSSAYPLIASGSKYYVNNIFNKKLNDINGLFTSYTDSPSQYVISSDTEYDYNAQISSSITFERTGTYKISLELLELDGLGSDSFNNILLSDSITYEVSASAPAGTFELTGSIEASSGTHRYYLYSTSDLGQPSVPAMTLEDGAGMGYADRELTSSSETVEFRLAKFYYNDLANADCYITIAINGGFPSVIDNYLTGDAIDKTENILIADGDKVVISLLNGTPS